MTTQRKTPWQCHSISTHQASHQPIPNNGKWSMRGLTSFLSFLTTAFEEGFQQPIAIQAHRTQRFRLLASVFSQVIDEGDSLCNHSDGSCHDNHNRYHVLVLLPHVSCLLFTLQRYCQRRKERQCISRLFAFTLKSWYASSLWGANWQPWTSYMSKGHIHVRRVLPQYHCTLTRSCPRTACPSRRQQTEGTNGTKSKKRPGL